MHLLFFLFTRQDRVSGEEKKKKNEAKWVELLVKEKGERRKLSFHTPISRTSKKQTVINQCENIIALSAIKLLPLPLLVLLQYGVIIIIIIIIIIIK